MKTRFLIIVVVVLSCVFSIPHVFAEMTFSEFQIFCSEIESQNWELYSIEQRQRSLLCGYSDILSEKYYDWIGIDRNWKNFAEQVSLEYAQEIPQYSETGIADSLIVNAFVSGRESFPPPMGARISFYYLDGNETKRFFEVYHVNLLGDFEKIMDYRTPTLKLFKMGYDIDEIKCKENLFLVQKHDGSPACVKEQTKQKLIQRGWALDKFHIPQIIDYLKQKPRMIVPEYVQYVETLALENPDVANFVRGVDWESQCCVYTARNNVDELNITFTNIVKQKSIRVTFILNTLELINIDSIGMTRIGVGLP